MLMLLSLSLAIGCVASLSVTQAIINERVINDSETALTLMSVTSAGNLMRDPNRYWKAVQVRLLSIRLRLPSSPLLQQQSECEAAEAEQSSIT